MVPLPPGSRLPDLTLKSADGRPATLPEGEAVLAFFKTDCPACELAWPYLERIRERGDGGFSVLAVSQDDPDATARFYARLGVRIPTVYDPEPWPASRALGLESVPTFLRLAADLTVRETTVGFQKHKMAELAEEAARLAGRPAPALFGAGQNVPAIKPG